MQAASTPRGSPRNLDAHGECGDPHTITVKAYDDAVPPNVGTASVVVTK